MTDPFITDRKELAKSAPPKTARFPRTGRRIERIHDVLDRRQPDLSVVLENVHDPHNVAAVLRSCDAVGAMSVHIVQDPATKPHRAFSRRTSGSAAKWLELFEHPDIDSQSTGSKAAAYFNRSSMGGPPQRR